MAITTGIQDLTDIQDLDRLFAADAFDECTGWCGACYRHPANPTLGEWWTYHAPNAADLVAVDLPFPTGGGRVA